MAPVTPSDPTPDHPDVAALVAELTDAAAAVEALTGAPPAGVRAVEITPGRSVHVCAVPPDGVALLVDGRLATRRRDVHQALTAVLVGEHLLQVIDPEALEYLMEAGGRAIVALDGEPEVADAIAAVLHAVHGLVAWRQDPLRERTSLPDVDYGAALQERAWRAYGAFVRRSDALAQAQDALTPELVSALRVWEEAAGRAGVTERLADGMGQVMKACDDAAAELVDRHVTPLT